MNKQELIEKYESKRQSAFLRLGEHLNDKAYTEILEDLKQLDEPQKVKVPQFVADWYEEHKDDFETNLFRAVDLIPSDYEEGDLSEFEGWLVDEHTAPFQTLVNMHQFGYTVEKEKRYRVKMKNIHSYSSILKLDDITGEYFFGSEVQMCASSSDHTRKELEEAGFGEVFDSQLFEVEEVE